MPLIQFSKENREPDYHLKVAVATTGILLHDLPWMCLGARLGFTSVPRLNPSPAL